VFRTDFAGPKKRFITALAQLLRFEPQPVGDGAVHRAAKQLLSTGHYKFSSAVAARRLRGTRPPAPRTASGRICSRARIDQNQ
jgi:hypothetical protein